MNYVHSHSGPSDQDVVLQYAPSALPLTQDPNGLTSQPPISSVADDPAPTVPPGIDDAPHSPVGQIALSDGLSRAENADHSIETESNFHSSSTHGMTAPLAVPLDCWPADGTGYVRGCPLPEVAGVGTG